MSDVLTTGPYPSVEYITGLARALVNDMVLGPAGVTFTDDAAFMLPFLNSSIMELQSRLENNGVQTFKKDNVILTPITPVVLPDPAVQVSVGFLGYFDGSVVHASPVLPSNCMSPMKLWSRPTGSNLPFKEMTQPQEGLPSGRQGPGLGQWEWREDAIWMNGCTTSMDLRLRYVSRLPLIAPTANFLTTVIPIRDCTNALSYMLAKAYALARGAQISMTACDAQIEKFVRILVNREVRQRQAVPYRRKPYGDTGHGNEGW